ncbi:MAG: Vi polysaccharide biosynthesis protein VipA/TviB, partial [Epsilonproteobacteria bacterium]
MAKNKICIVGLGYAGLPLAHAFAEKYDVIGVDINENRVAELRSGKDFTLELNEHQLKEVKDSLVFTT